MYQVFSLKDTYEYAENILNDTVYQTHQKLMEAYHHTGREMKMDFRKFTSGRYKLVVIAEDQHGEEVKQSKFLHFTAERQTATGKDLCLVVTIQY